jgi:predicted aspartyl protease
MGRLLRSSTRAGMAACLCAILETGPVLAESDGTTCVETRRATAELLLAPVEVAAPGRSARQLWFLIDTGSGVTMVDDEVVRALKVPPSARTTVVTTGGPIDVLTSRLSITFGALRVDDLEVVRHPLAEVRAIDPDIHGILGQDVLRRANWLLDYRLGVVIQDPQRTLAEAGNGERMRMRWIGERPAVEVAFDRSMPVHLVLDSAANRIVLFRPAGAHATTAASQTTTLAGSMTTSTVTARALRLGSTILPHAIAAVLPRDRDVDEADGVLPASLFDTVYFDYGRSTVLLTPAASQAGRRRIIRPRCEAGASLLP